MLPVSCCVTNVLAKACPTRWNPFRQVKKWSWNVQARTCLGKYFPLFYFHRFPVDQLRKLFRIGMVCYWYCLWYHSKLFQVYILVLLFRPDDQVWFPLWRITLLLIKTLSRSTLRKLIHSWLHKLIHKCRLAGPTSSKDLYSKCVRVSLGMVF